MGLTIDSVRKQGFGLGAYGVGNSSATTTAPCLIPPCPQVGGLGWPFNVSSSNDKTDLTKKKDQPFWTGKKIRLFLGIGIVILGFLIYKLRQ